MENCWEASLQLFTVELLIAFVEHNRGTMIEAKLLQFNSYYRKMLEDHLHQSFPTKHLARHRT